LLIGGFLHDIGKVYEFSFERSVDYTDAGQLLGHLVMEVELVDQKIAHDSLISRHKLALLGEAPAGQSSRRL